ncbi:MAG: type IV secretory system conjugative DNA transfer family protein [Clostridia bacterium]|nr:type IV secretory system conjugative DNA transfer family protein [Clostridia bacterium]MDD4386451.1 type IV secretory system conjugative DNA transfer family protein [Clostridia bacterium]
MFETILNKLHIKTKPNKLLTYLFYSITIFITLISISKILTFLVGDPRIQNIASPYWYSLWFMMPVLAYSYYVNSGMAKSDSKKINIFIFTYTMFCILLSTVVSIYVNSVIWFLLEKLSNFTLVYNTYPELFSPGIKTVSVLATFIGMFYMFDYFLLIFRDDDLPKAIAGYNGLSTQSTVKDTGVFSCSTVICKNKGTTVPVIVPEKKRYESTLVQGATGTGKTATVLLPMSALDVEKKYFFREYSKRLGYSLLKKGIAYVTGPYDNEFINKNFSMSFIKPRRGMEEQFLIQVRNLIQYSDSETGQIVYKNLGLTIVENDGKYISDFTAVAKNFDIEVLSVDPTNIENTLSINPFAIEEPPKVASIIADVLKSMYENEGGGAPGDPFFTQVTLDAFQNLAILLKEMYPVLNNGDVASLEDMLELLYNFDKVEELTEEMKKIKELEQKYKLLIAYFEKNFYKPSLNINGYEIPGTRGSGRKETERFLYGAITQLNNLLRHPGLKKALCGKTNILEFDKALEDGSVITACSRKGDLGIIQSKAFGMFFIMQFQDAILRRKGNEDSRIPHFLYIDEFPEYLNKDMEVMFTLFRKYRCGVTVAIQNLSQLEKGGKSASYYRQTVLANTKTQIVFGDTVPEDTEYWEKAFGKEKVPDSKTKFNFEASGLVATPTLEVYPKNRADGWKLSAQAFGAVYYKTKNAAGKSIYGQGQTNFLQAKYKQKHPAEYYNFEKYMMSKPEGPTIDLNTSDSSDNDDLLFGVNTTSRLMDELKSSNVGMFKNTVKEEKYANVTTASPTSLNTGFEIEFDDLEPKLDNAKINGGAITETYESPVIKRKN